MAPASRPHIPNPHYFSSPQPSRPTPHPSSHTPSPQPLAASSEFRNHPSGSFRRDARQSNGSEPKTAWACPSPLKVFRGSEACDSSVLGTRQDLYPYPAILSTPRSTENQLWARFQIQVELFPDLVPVSQDQQLPGAEPVSRSSVGDVLAVVADLSPSGPVIPEEMKLLVLPPRPPSKSVCTFGEYLAYLGLA